MESTRTYPDKAIVKIESESCRSSNKGLAELRLDGIADKGFHIWARTAIEVGSELSRSCCNNYNKERKKQSRQAFARHSFCFAPVNQYIFLINKHWLLMKKMCIYNALGINHKRRRAAAVYI